MHRSEIICDLCQWLNSHDSSLANVAFSEQKVPLNQNFIHECRKMFYEWSESKSNFLIEANGIAGINNNQNAATAKSQFSLSLSFLLSVCLSFSMGFSWCVIFGKFPFSKNNFFLEFLRRFVLHIIRQFHWIDADNLSMAIKRASILHI